MIFIVNDNSEKCEIIPIPSIHNEFKQIIDTPTYFYALQKNSTLIGVV